MIDFFCLFIDINQVWSRYFLFIGPYDLISIVKGAKYLLMALSTIEHSKQKKKKIYSLAFTCFLHAKADGN